MGRFLTFIAILVGLLSPIVYVLEKNLESFYIFQPDQLHDVAKRAIAAHGNNTRAVVDYIVTELHQQLPLHVNLDEDWMFNNAGGAMGAMYIIHASQSLNHIHSTVALC
jgi:C-8 sterol isomerase